MSNLNKISLMFFFFFLNCGRQIHEGHVDIEWSNLPESFFYNFGGELTSYIVPDRAAKISTYGHSSYEPIIWAYYSIFRNGHWAGEEIGSFIDCGTGLDWNRLSMDTLRIRIENPLSEILADLYLPSNHDEQFGRYYFFGVHQFDFFAKALFSNEFKEIFDSTFGDSVSVRFGILTKPDNPDTDDNRLYSQSYKFASDEIYYRWVTSEHQRLSLNNKFVLAVAENNLDSVKAYLKMGIGVNAQTDSTNLFYLAYPVSALHLAKSAEAINLLLDKGADINAIDNEGNTALHIAVKQNKIELAKVLIRNGANIESKTETGFISIHLATRNGNWEIVKLLIANGCDVNAVDGDESTALHYCELFFCEDKREKMVFIKIAELLLASGANLHVRDAINRTPLDWANIRREQGCENDELVEVLR